MFIRETSGQTLTDVRDALPQQPETISVLNSEISVDLTGSDRVIRLRPGGDGNIEVPATETALTHLANWVEIPPKFFHRVDPDLQQHLLTTLLQRQAVGSHVLVDGDEIVSVRNPNQKVINPKRIVEAAMRVITDGAPVIEWWNDSDELRVDVVVPDNHSVGIGGDPAVNDLTKAGVRFGQDTKHNLAPWVQPFQYRLICTNGMETQTADFKVEMRGNTVEQVMAEFEAQADRAFKRAEAEIESFYSLRQERVDNPERTLIRMANERGLPDRTIVALAERLPAINEDGNVSMFDLVNLITNQANDPTIRNRTGARRALEVVGGSVVTEHAERCGHCQARLN